MTFVDILETGVVLLAVIKLIMRSGHLKAKQSAVEVTEIKRLDGLQVDHNTVSF